MFQQVLNQVCVSLPSLIMQSSNNLCKENSLFFIDSKLCIGTIKHNNILDLKTDLNWLLSENKFLM